jgi:hypothetical protein
VLARTSTDDQQDPTLSIPRQYGNCELALLPNMQILLAGECPVETADALDQRPPAMVTGSIGAGEGRAYDESVAAAALAQW